MPATATVSGNAGPGVKCANLELRQDAAQVLVDGARLELTEREFQLLAALVDRRDRVVPRAELYSAVWRRRMAYRDRSVDVFVRKLRLKLHEIAPGWEYIHTHFGIGYRFSARPAPPGADA